VMATMALNGPDEASRQANARASRWNWSHETGKALSRGAFTSGSFAKYSPFLSSAMKARDPSSLQINTFCDAGFRSAPNASPRLLTAPKP
jgi:hypothetical protein